MGDSKITGYNKEPIPWISWIHAAMLHRLKFTVAFYDLATYSGIRDLRTDKLGRCDAKLVV